MGKTFGRSSLVGAMSLLAVTIVACSDDDDSKYTIAANRFPAAYAQALCGSLRHCCDENTVSLSFTDCTAGWKSYVERLLTGPSALTNYEPRKAKACVDRIRAAESTSCAPVPNSISDARDTCSAIFVGKKPLGAPCSAAAECAASDNGKRVGCEPPLGSDADAGVLPLSVPLDFIALSTPVCVELGNAGITSPCLPTEGNARGSCDVGLFCEPTSRTCAPLGAVGAKCVPGSCAPGGACSTSGPNAGTCVPTAPLGGPCAAAEQCDATSRCDVGAGTCVTKKIAGESCTADSECLIGVCDDVTHRCLKNAIATSNTCNGRTE